MICNFTLKHYEEILKLALEKGYHFLLFQEDAAKYEKIIYLRHDIDVSPDNAIILARIENKLGIRANYFYLIHDIFYNIFEKKPFEDIQEIIRLGHRMGLHFDDDFYANRKNKLGNFTRRIIQDLKLFSTILGTKIKIVSFHNPSMMNIPVKRIQSKEFINVYSDKYFKGIKYLSDSLQNWKGDCPCKILVEKKYKKIQILIHPCWWNEKSLSPYQIANNHIFEKCQKMNEYLRGYPKIYRRKESSKNQCPLYFK